MHHMICVSQILCWKLQYNGIVYILRENYQKFIYIYLKRRWLFVSTQEDLKVRTSKMKMKLVYKTTIYNEIIHINSPKKKKN